MSETDDGPWDPNWVMAPGEIMREEMQELHLSERVFCRGLGLSGDELGALLAGDLPLTDALAERLGGFFGMSAQFWKNLERRYRTGLAAGRQVVR